MAHKMSELHVCRIKCRSISQIKIAEYMSDEMSEMHRKK